ncbi:hypothetical protein MIND_00900400 [Mycena indigotica]|uniref:Uncharacterized protein n=1 Tax=Mycena indigotica TaxID=2126181 RepID=A0A8H6SH66_9AGAR|nr:uncharacterized protein MIND_00900400 [Mycena indigotica]KAF7299503.1 hypothetical protein MIND_00900400 [Mycena indigotica]
MHIAGLFRVSLLVKRTAHGNHNRFRPRICAGSHLWQAFSGAMRSWAYLHSLRHSKLPEWALLLLYRMEFVSCEENIVPSARPLWDNRHYCSRSRDEPSEGSDQLYVTYVWKSSFVSPSQQHLQVFDVKTPILAFINLIFLGFLKTLIRPQTYLLVFRDRL